MSKTSPCKGCTERCIGCHSNCDMYQKWNRDRVELQNKVIVGKLQDTLSEPTYLHVPGKLKKSRNKYK